MEMEYTGCISMLLTSLVKPSRKSPERLWGRTSPHVPLQPQEAAAAFYQISERRDECHSDANRGMDNVQRRPAKNYQLAVRLARFEVALLGQVVWYRPSRDYWPRG